MDSLFLYLKIKKYCAYIYVHKINTDIYTISPYVTKEGTEFLVHKSSQYIFNLVSTILEILKISNGIFLEPDCVYVAITDAGIT